MKDPRDKFELSDIYDPLEQSNGLIFKHMFGGMAVYSEGLMKFCHMEDPGNNSYKDKVYDYDIWHGLLVCSDYPHHESLIEDFDDLVNHPVLPKWLYLPFLDEEDFRRTAKRLMMKALKKDPRIGIVPGRKKRKSKAKKKAKKKKKLRP